MTYNYNSLRFGDQTDLTFPEVSYYTFPNNQNIRGISDRTFTWKETFLDVPYLYREATTSGQFEVHSLLSGITTPQLVTTTSAYSGWTTTGQSIYHIGESGTYFEYYDAWAYPIAGNTAIVLNSTGTETKVYQDISITNMPTDRLYQLYLVVRSLSGTGKVNPYITAKEGVISTVYYNPYTTGWSVSSPTGYFLVPNTGYTEIIYTFTNNNTDIQLISDIFVDTFQVIVSQASGESIPVIIDEVHLDEILVRDPYVDFFIPTGYIIQITPDIGWHNIKDMFTSSGNPYLKTFGPYTPSNLGLTDNLDGSVSVTLTESEFTESLYQNYKKYLWQAIAVSPDGTLGDIGIPQKFDYIGRILDKEFSITLQDYDPLSVMHIVEGIKPKNSIVLVDGEVSVNVEYPTENSWRFTLILDAESRVIEFKALDSGGATSSKQYCTFQNTYSEQVTNILWNSFDDHGLMMDIKRLSGESNYNFKNRIKDVQRSPGGPTYQGIVNSANRELGLVKVTDAFTIEIVNSSFSEKKNISADVEVNAYSLKIRSSIDIKTEVVFSDPVTGFITLSKNPRRIVEIKTAEGTRISSKYYHIDRDEDSFTTVARLNLIKEDFYGKYLTVTYEYYDVLLFSQYPTLYDLKTAINSLNSASGTPYLKCSLSSYLSGGESVLGLYKESFTVNRSQPIAIGWSPVFLNRISDRNFRKLFVSGESQLYQTQYYRYVKELKHNLKVFWENAEMDRDYWGIAENIKNSLDHVPTITDPILGHYINSTISNTRAVSSSSAWGDAYLDSQNSKIVNYGVDPKLFSAGIGFGTDIQLSIEVVNTNTGLLYSSHSAIPSVKNDNKMVFFSGQR